MYVSHIHVWVCYTCKMRNIKTVSSSSNKTGLSKIAKKILLTNRKRMNRGKTNNWMQRKQNISGVRYGNRENITERIDNRKKERKELEEGTKVVIHLKSLKNNAPKYLTGKKPGCDALHRFVV